MPTHPVTELALAYERVGNGPQPILFVHGSFASSRWWRPVAELLPPDEFTCYLPDLCGCGRSGRSEDPANYRVEQQVADLSAFIEQLDLYNLHLVGHSLGAAIALTYAATDSTRLRSLTLVSTPSPAGTPTPPEGYELLEQMRVDRGLLSQALASIMPARAPDAFFQQVVDDAHGQAPAAFTATAEALDQWRLPPAALAQLRLPVLLMWGDRDQIVERDGQTRLLLSIPGANNLEVFRGAGHSPMLERTKGFVEALLTFIGQDFVEYAALRQSVD
jgi:branched-chain amino acid transport system permease protein